MRLGQRGEGMGMSAVVNWDRRGLMRGGDGLGSVSFPEIPLERAAAVERTGLHADDWGDGLRTVRREKDDTSAEIRITMNF